MTPENDFRSLCQWKEESLGYGEITEQAIFKILLQHIGLCRLQATPVQTMVDLGSGTGRVVLAAAIALSPFLKVAMGLEIVPELHTQALELQTLWNRKAYTVSPFDCESDDDSCKNQLDTATMATTRLDFQCVDFTRNTEWTKSADLVFMHCTVFEEALFVTACDLCVTVKPGTWIITVSRPLLQCFDEATVASAMPDGTFEIISELHLEMSWGRGRVFVQRKL